MNSLLIEISRFIFIVTSSTTHIVFPCTKTLLTAAGFTMATMFGSSKTGKEQRQVTLQSSHYTV
jgi:hypothetical protein